VDQGYPDEEVLGRVEALRKGLEAAGAEDGDDASAGLDSRYGTVLCSWYTCM
jgi:hypothetical protein